MLNYCLFVFGVFGENVPSVVFVKASIVTHYLTQQSTLIFVGLFVIAHGFVQKP